MKTLGFARLSCVVHGRRIRPSLFQPRSTLPISAACLVANAARQTLTELLHAPVSLKLLEPVLPDSDGWSSIGTEALIFSVCGAQSNAAIVLRSQDALALVCAALGERSRGPRGLSPVENELAARIASALCVTLAPVCGLREPLKAERAKTLQGYLTYFELILEEPVRARVGIALAREPQPQVVPELKPSDVHDVEVDLRAEIAHGFLPAAAIVALHAGAVLKLDSALGDPAHVLVGGTTWARGQCGHLGARRALVIQ